MGVGVRKSKQEKNGGRDYLHGESKVFVVCHCTIQKWQDYYHIRQVHTTTINGSPCLYHTKNSVLYAKENVNLKNDMLKFSFHKITVNRINKMNSRCLTRKTD